MWHELGIAAIFIGILVTGRVIISSIREHLGNARAEERSYAAEDLSYGEEATERWVESLPSWQERRSVLRSQEAWMADTLTDFRGWLTDVGSQMYDLRVELAGGAEVRRSA